MERLEVQWVIIAELRFPGTRRTRGIHGGEAHAMRHWGMRQAPCAVVDQTTTKAKLQLDSDAARKGDRGSILSADKRRLSEAP